MKKTLTAIALLLLLAPGHSIAAESPASSAVDQDALCLVIVRGAALGSKRASADAMRDIETAFAYFAGRVSARHAPGSITPHVATALKWDPPKPEYDLKGMTCLAYGMSGASGRPADRDSSGPGEAEPGAADTDVTCALLMHAANTNSAAQIPERRRGIALAAAYYAGRITGRHGAPAYAGLLAAAANPPPLADQLQALGDDCFRGGSRGVRAVNLEIDAALPRSRR